MKMGKLEGSPEKIRDFFQNNGLNIQDYLEKPEPPLKRILFIVPVLLIAGAISLLTLIAPSAESAQNFLFLTGCGAGIWLAVNVQIRYKNTWAAVFTAVGTVLLMLVAFGEMAPSELVQHMKDLKK